MDVRAQVERDLIEKAIRFLPSGDIGNMPLDYDHSIIIKNGLGSRIWDFSGNEYIDYLMGSGPMILGHTHPAVVTAVKKAVDSGSTFFATNEYAVLLAEELVKAIPCADKVRFTTSGTDACFQALRIARSFTKREKILKFEGGFHGTSDYSLMSNPPNLLKDFPAAEPSSGGIPKAIEDLVLVAPFNDAGKTTSIIEQYQSDLAGVIIEPMQRFLPPKEGFLSSLREVTSHYKIPLIFDEVVTGFRLAYGGAQEHYGITPDLTAVGKIMGGGYPIAAICGREELMDSYDSSKTSRTSHIGQIGTLNGNPVACAAGLATLSELRKPGVYQRLKEIGQQLRRSLEHLCVQAEMPAQTVGEDTVFDIVFTSEPLSDFRSTLAADINKKIMFRNFLQEAGVFLGAQKFYPSLAHTDNDISQSISAFQTAIDRMEN